MRFHSVVQLNGKTATGIVVPAEVVTGLGSSKKPQVRVTINGYTYRSSIASRDGQYMIPVSAEVRASAGIAANDEVEVDVELDTEPREVTLPADFASALDGNAEAKRFFAGLSYSNKRQLVTSITDAKTPETRTRRITKAITMLREGRV